MTELQDRVAEYNLLLLGMILRVFRLKGRAQIDELRKLLDFVADIPERLAPEVRTLLADFDGETGVWGFVRDEQIAEDQLPGDLILEQIRANV